MSYSSLPAEADVLIVGAGPTGLALSVSLLQAGIEPVVIDRLPAGQTTSRAAVIHAHTLEAMRSLGVADRLTAFGVRVNHFSLRDRDQLLVRLSFEQLPSEFAYLLMLPQDVTEAVLAERLRELGGVVHRGVTAESIECRPDGVRAWVSEGAGQRSIDARFVVGADGMRSIVRESAGISFLGEQYEHSFVLADVRMHWPLSRDEVNLFFGDAGPVVVAPLPNGAFRVVAAMENAPENPTSADIQWLLDAYGPATQRAEVTEVLWGSRFRIHHRLAEKYRKGRLLLMGDAAHVHSPAGGQGMNTGLVDAVVLGKLLSAVVSGKKREQVLDRYEKLRRPAAQKVLALANDLTEMAMTRGAASRALRNARLRLIGHLPPARRKMILNLSGLSRRASAQAGV